MNDNKELDLDSYFKQKSINETNNSILVGVIITALGLLYLVMSNWAVYGKGVQTILLLIPTLITVFMLFNVKLAETKTKNKTNEAKSGVELIKEKLFENYKAITANVATFSNIMLYLALNLNKDAIGFENQFIFIPIMLTYQLIVTFTLKGELSNLWNLMIIAIGSVISTTIFSELDMKFRVVIISLVTSLILSILTKMTSKTKSSILNGIYQIGIFLIIIHILSNLLQGSRQIFVAMPIILSAIFALALSTQKGFKSGISKILKGILAISLITFSYDRLISYNSYSSRLLESKEYNLDMIFYLVAGIMAVGLIIILINNIIKFNIKKSTVDDVIISGFGILFVLTSMLQTQVEVYLGILGALIPLFIVVYSLSLFVKNSENKNDDLEAIDKLIGAILLGGYVLAEPSQFRFAILFIVIGTSFVSNGILKQRKMLKDEIKNEVK